MASSIEDDNQGRDGGVENAENSQAQGAESGSKPTMTYSQIMEQKISSMLQEALQLHHAGDAGLAVAKLTRAIALEPRLPELFKNRAEAHLTLCNFHSAIINFKKALSLQPSEQQELTDRLATAHSMYGELLQEQGQYDRALKMFERASEYCPEDKENITRRMACLLSLQRYDECLAMIKQELLSDDSNPNLYVLRAQINLLFGNTTPGYYDVCSALQLDPLHSEATKMKKQMQDKAMACKNQAVHHSLVGKRMEAMKKITTAIETDPAVSEYHVFRGAVHRRMGDFNAAVDDFLAAMDKCDHQQECEVYRDASRQLVLTYNDFAVECFRRRRFSEAVTLLNKAIKEEKGERGLYLNRGDCFYRMNNLHFALVDYQQALELDQSDWSVRCRVAVVHCELGVECYGRGEHSEAEGHFTCAIRCNPKVSRFYLCRARARHELKDTAGSREDLLASLILDPSNEECLPLIARVFPGKSKVTLLQSGDAVTVKTRLKSDIQRSSPKKESSRSNTKESDLPYRIDLKFADEGMANEGDSPTRGGQFSQSTVQWEPPNAPSSKGLESLDRFPTIPDPSPRPYAVLEQPLPSHGESGVLPPLKTCLQESDFHSQIYYSKKNCTAEVQRALRSPTKFGTHPSLQTTHEVNFSGRTVISRNRIARTQ